MAHSGTLLPFQHNHRKRYRLPGPPTLGTYKGWFLTVLLEALGDPIGRLRSWSMVFPAEIRMFWAVVASTMAGLKCYDLKSKRALPLDNFFHEPVKCLCQTLSLAS